MNAWAASRKDIEVQYFLWYLYKFNSFWAARVNSWSPFNIPHAYSASNPGTDGGLICELKHFTKRKKKEWLIK